MKIFSWENLFLISILFLPFSFGLNPTSSIDLSLVRVVFPLIFILWFFTAISNKKLLLDKKLSFWSLLCFLFICFISIFWSVDFFVAFKKNLFLLSFLPVYFLSFAITQKPILRTKLLKMLVLSAFMTSVYAFLIFSLQFIIGLDRALAFASKSAVFFLGENFSTMVLAFPSWMVNINGATILRTFGPFPDPHLFAIFINLTLPFFLYLWFKTGKKYYLLGFLFCFLMSLLSFSRASYLALFSSSLFFIFFISHPTPLLKKYFGILLFLMFFIFLCLVIPNPLTTRLFSSFDIGEGSNSGRIEMWTLAMKTIEEKPLYGVGLGSFTKYNFPMENERNPIYAHNLFLDFASEIGIFGTSFLILSLFLIMLGSSQKNSPFLKQAVATSVFIFIIHSLFETPLFSIRVLPLFFLIMGLSTDD